MTREEAIKWLKLLKISPLIYGEYPEAIDMAIEALSADAVSRDVHVGIVNELVKRIEELKADSVKVVRKSVKGYGGYYEVDQFGRVFAVDRVVHVSDNGREYDKHLPSRQMKQSVHTKGYKTVPLTKGGKTTTKFVHRLVAEAFIPNPDDLPFVNHIDEDKTNNFVENLEWCTEQYNSTYGKAREKHAKALKGRLHTEEHKKKISDSLKRFHGERREP